MQMDEIKSRCDSTSTGLVGLEEGQGNVLWDPPMCNTVVRPVIVKLPFVCACFK